MRSCGSCGERCNCIRCREIGSAERRGALAGKLQPRSLRASTIPPPAGREIFLSFEDAEKDLLAAFLRLRIPGRSHRREIDAGAPSPSGYSSQRLPVRAAGMMRQSPTESRGVLSSIVRELHVYGQEAAIGEDAPLKMQHKGLGRKLLAEAEEITRKEFGLSKIACFPAQARAATTGNSAMCLTGLT